MKIVRMANFVTPISGGLRTAMHELGAGYLAAGHQPVLIVPGRSDTDVQTPCGRMITLRGPRLPFSGGYRVLLRKRKLAALLAELTPDRLEVSDRTTLRWTGRWAREHHVPAVVVSHESPAGLLGLSGRWLSPVTARIAAALNSRTAANYETVICTTEWAAAEFRRLGTPNLIRVPLGVDLAAFHPRWHSAQVRARYAAPEEILLVHCGRLSAEKQPGISVAALAALRAAGLAAILVIAGDGRLRRRLERQVRRSGLPVRFAGFIAGRPELAALLASADVALAPGPVETFGLAALEALACGTPVVVNAASALPEVVGTAGSAVAASAFAVGIRAVLAMPEAGRRAAARERAETFGWSIAVDGFLAVHGAARALAGQALVAHQTEMQA